MKPLKAFLYLFLVLSVNVSLAQGSHLQKKQRKKSLKLQEKIDRLEDEDFNVYTAPPQYKDEPMVILCQKYYIAFFSGSYSKYFATPLPDLPESRTAVVLTRKRLLLKEQNIVNQFSEFYYSQNSAVGAKVIKPDKSVETVDFSEAIHVKSKVPAFYKKDYQFKDYYKIAIPNLEVGDIFEYFTLDYISSNGVIELSSSLYADYPIVYQQYLVEAYKLTTPTLNTPKGTPAFKKTQERRYSFLGDTDALIESFVFQDSLRDARNRTQWNFFYQREPTIKMSSSQPSLHPKKSAYDERIDLKNNKRVSFWKEKPSFLIKEVKKKIRFTSLKSKTVEERCKILYHAIKFQTISSDKTQAFSYHLAGRKEVFDSYKDMKFEHYFQIDGKTFANIFYNLLRASAVESQPVISVPKNKASIHDVGMYRELEYGVFVPAINKYFWAPNTYSLVGDTPANLTGSTALIFDRKGKSFTPREIVLPSSRPEDNTIHTSLSISINPDQTLAIKDSVRLNGAFRERYSPLFFYGMEIFPELKQQKASKFKVKQIKTRIIKDNVEEQELKQAGVQEWLADEYQVDTLLHYEVSPFEKTKKSGVLEVNFEFQSSDFLQKAGPHLVLNVGALISSQVALTEEEIKGKDKDIELGFARQFIYDIKIKLPEGYKAQHPDKLAVHKTNDSGTFIADLHQENDMLYIQAKKVYKKEKILAKEWSQLVEMLEAAYNFSQAKLILKKN